MCVNVRERERALERNLPVAQGQSRLRCLQLLHMIILDSKLLYFENATLSKNELANARARQRMQESVSTSIRFQCVPEVALIELIEYCN